MPAAITDLIDRVTDSTTGRPVVSTLASPGKSVGAPSITITDPTNWSTTAAIHFSIYLTTAAGYKDPTTQTDWKGVLSGTTVSGLTITGGTDRSYTAGAIVEITPTARYSKDLYDLLISFANQDGSLKSTAVQNALNLGSGSLNGWNALAFPFNSVVANGNRSYTCTISGQDQTGTLSPGMRIRTTRTVAAPTQCTTLNGTNQFWNRSATINGMTFTNNFTVSAWVKLSSYPAVQGDIISRWDGTNGWILRVDSAGRVLLIANNGGAGNAWYTQSYQSLPLNKWVHVYATLDMSGRTSATNKTMIDGVDVPVSLNATGTNPTALIQAGNLNVGACNSTNFFPGKIAQAAVFSAVISEATMLTYISQGLLGTETSLISAYSFNGNANDLNTTNANNLTSNNGAVATTADSFCGYQAGGAISSTLDYGIVQSATFSTNTTVVVQVPEGCTIPTSGGVSAVAYSGVKAPYGMPVQKDKWDILVVAKADLQATGLTTSTWFGLGATGQLVNISVPVGAWNLSYQAMSHVTCGAATFIAAYLTLATAVGSETDAELSAFPQAMNTSTTENFTFLTRNKNISVASATPYYLNIKSNNASISVLSVTGTQVVAVIKAENAYL
jgi:hypothetical protein